MAENKKSTTVKKEAAKPSATAHEKELEDQINSMMKMIAELQSQLAANKVAQPAPEVPQAQPTIVVSAPNTDVTLVYLSDSLGYIKCNNLELNCTRYGEEFTVTRSDFDAVVGKYRHWFDRGILAVSYRNVDVAVAKGIKTDKDYVLDAKSLAGIGKMSCDELEKLWNETKSKDQKLSIVTYYKRKFIEGEDESYRDRAKIDLLNRLTNGGFDREAVELSGRNTELKPTAFI